MLLNQQQLQEVLDILDKQIAVFVVSTHGPKFLTDKEHKVLKQYLGDYKHLYDKNSDYVWLNFQLGMLSHALGDDKVKFMDYPTFKKYISKGNYLPLTAKEKFTIDSVKAQSLTDIRAFKGRIFQDINQVVNQTNLDYKKDQEEFIKKEIVSGMENKEGIKKIISNLGHKTGDWSRDFSKSVEYISHSALNEGKTAMISKKGGLQAKVYFIVQPNACKYCQSAYLNRDGSPKVFTVEELEANGSNIGRKAVDWLPTIHAMHPFCRCLVQELPEGYIWNGSKFAPEKKPNIYGVKVKVG